MRYYGEAGLGIRSKIVAGFLGIDLTSVEAKPSACVGLDRELNLIYAFPRQDSDILRVVSRYSLELVAIDAPLSLPEGLCCLEESCSAIQRLRLRAGVVSGS